MPAKGLAVGFWRLMAFEVSIRDSSTNNSRERLLFSPECGAIASSLAVKPFGILDVEQAKQIGAKIKSLYSSTSGHTRIIFVVEYSLQELKNSNSRKELIFFNSCIEHSTMTAAIKFSSLWYSRALYIATSSSTDHIPILRL